MKRVASCNSSDSDGTCYKRMKINNAKDKKPALNLRAPETTPNGQLLLNPNLTMDEATLFAKREYNRRNAARARYRTKGLQDTLQQKVYRLAQDTEKLQKERKELEKLISDLQTQNRQLLEDRTNRDNRSSFSFLGDGTVPNHLLWTAQQTSQDHRQSSLLQKLQAIDSINREQAMAVDPVRTAIMILESLSPRLHFGSL